MHEERSKLQRVCEAAERARQRLITENSDVALRDYGRLSALMVRGIVAALRNWADTNATLAGEEKIIAELARLDLAFSLCIHMAQEALMLGMPGVGDAQLAAVDICHRQAQLTFDLQAARKEQTHGRD